MGELLIELLIELKQTNTNQTGPSDMDVGWRLQQRNCNNQLSDPDIQLYLQHITNPRKAKGHQDLVVNNPLSQDEGVSESSRACQSASSFYFQLSPLLSGPCSCVQLNCLTSISSAVLLTTPGNAGIASSNL